MKNKGMTLFIAVTVMGILLFISFAVVNIALKGTIFASSGRDSQFAFYAADAGLECALYWDSKYDYFSTSTANTITCATQSSLVGGGGDANQTSTFNFTMNQGLNSVPHCVIVTVRKYYEGSPLVLKIYIKSKGYNTCDTSNLRRVERGIEVSY